MYVIGRGGIRSRQIRHSDMRIYVGLVLCVKTHKDIASYMLVSHRPRAT